MGLSPFNCHKNAATIVRVGGDMKALVNALACELPPVGIPRRQEHIDFNTRLISKSNELLAPVNGAEWHFARWIITSFKAVLYH